jgi:hypothetical protein
MTKEEQSNSFHSLLSSFTGTEQYFYNPLFKKINYTEGVRYFMQNAGGGAYWFLTLVATEIIPKLENEFYFIELTVNKDKTANIIVQLDKGEPILYEKNLEYTDCPPSDEPYKFCLDYGRELTILCLLSEY